MPQIAELILTAKTESLKRAEQDLDKLSAAGGRTEKASDKMAAGMSRAAKAAIAMGVAAAAAAGAMVFRGAIREAEQLERNMLRTNAIIQATGGVAGRSAKQLHEQARALAATTLASTEGVMKAQQTLLTFRNIRGEVFDDAIAGAMDLASAMGTDLNSATLQLAKALEDPITGMTALTRSGTVFTEAQKEMVKGMVEVGDTAKAQNFILGELSAQYGGVAAKEASGLAGSQDTLSQSFQELMIVIGDGLMPVVKGFVDFLVFVVRDITAVVTAIGSAASAFAEFGRSIFTASMTQNEYAAAVGVVNEQIAAEKLLLDELNGSMAPGTRMTLDAAEAKLQQAEAIRSRIEAGAQELRQIAMEGEEYKKLGRLIAGINQAIEDAILDKATSPESLWAEAMQDVQYLQEELKAAEAAQKELLTAAGALPPEYDDATKTIDILRAAIAEARGGMVVLGAETTNAADTTAALARLSGEIDYSNAVSGAQALAAQLNISLHAAMKMMGLLGAANQATFNGEALDPRNPQYNTANARLERTRVLMEELASGAKVVTKEFANFGGAATKAGGAASGAGKAAADAAQSAIEKLQLQIDQERELIGLSDKAKEQLDAVQQVERALASDKAQWNRDEIDALAEKIVLNKELLEAEKARSKVLGTIFDGIVSGDIKGIGNSILGMAQNSFSGLLKGAFGTGGGGFGAVLSGIKSSFAGIGSALSTGVGLIGKLGGALSAALPVIGLVSTAISFFKTKTTELDAGLRVAVTGLDAMVETFRTVEKIKFFGLSKKVSTTGTAAEFEIANPIQLAVQNVGERVTELANVLGLAAGNIAKTTFDFEVSTKGKSDSEIQKAIEAELGRLGNTFADAVIGSYTEFLPDEAELARIEKAMEATFNIGGRGGEAAGEARRAALEQQRIAAQTAIEITHLNESFAGLQREGEGSLAMLERVVASLHAVNEALYLFDRAALDMTVSGASAATKLVELAGGLEAFGSKTQFVFQNMLTSAAQDLRLTEIAMDSLNSVFGDLQFAIPETHAQFMALMDAQDLTTEAGRQTYAALLDVAGAFVQVNGTAQAAAEALKALKQQEVDDAKTVLQNQTNTANTALTDANKALTDAENALRASFAAEADAIRAAYDDLIREDRAITDAMNAMAKAQAAESDRLRKLRLEAMETQADLLRDRVSLKSDIVDALERAYTDRRVLSAIGQRMQLANAQAFLRAAVQSGGTDDVDRLEAALAAVENPSTALFGSFQDYHHDFNTNTNLIGDLKFLSRNQLSTEEKSLVALEQQIDALRETSSAEIESIQANTAAIEAARDAELSALNNQMNGLLGINASVISVAQAIGGLKAAQDAQKAAQDVADTFTPPTDKDPVTNFNADTFGGKLNALYNKYLGRDVRQEGLDWYSKHFNDYGWSMAQIEAQIAASPEAMNFQLTGIPKFDGGGYTGDGLRSGGLDGQGGFMAMLHPRETVIDHTRQRGGGSDNSAVVAQLMEMNERIRDLQKENKRQARILSDWTTTGLPGTRDGAVVKTEELV